MHTSATVFCWLRKLWAVPGLADRHLLTDAPLPVKALFTHLHAGRAVQMPGWSPLAGALPPRPGGGSGLHHGQSHQRAGCCCQTGCTTFPQGSTLSHSEHPAAKAKAVSTSGQDWTPHCMIPPVSCSRSWASRASALPQQAAQSMLRVK